MLTQDTNASRQRNQEERAAAADDDRQQNRQNRSSCFDLVRARDPDAVQYQTSNARYDSATNRNHLKGTGRTLRKCQNPEGRLKRFPRATHNHQTKMNHSRADK